MHTLAGTGWRYCLNKGIGSYLSKRRLSEDKVIPPHPPFHTLGVADWFCVKIACQTARVPRSIASLPIDFGGRLGKWSSGAISLTSSRGRREGFSSVTRREEKRRRRRREHERRHVALGGEKMVDGARVNVGTGMLLSGWRAR